MRLSRMRLSRVGASSSQPKEETEKYLKSIGVKKNKMPSAMKRLRRWAFLSKHNLHT
jgi:hypothetical protein